MARMKSEFLYHYRKRHGLTARDRLVAFLPRYAPAASALAPLLNLRNRVPALAWLQERSLGLSARRSLPAWHTDPFRDHEAVATGEGRDVVLLADTFNRWFEPENLRAALDVLAAGGYKVHLASSPEKQRPLCCGRTFLAAGLLDEARAEAERMLRALLPHARLGRPVIGLEPSCLFTLRDEFRALVPGGHSDSVADRAVLLEEFLAAEADAGRLRLALAPLDAKRALLHGHCHQKAFAAMDAVRKTLGLIPDLAVDTVESSCCGMAGAFGYQAEHHDLSMTMAEMDLLPAVRRAGTDTVLVADGTSCRHQIADGTAREAIHVARVLAAALVERAG
jgi:Fe-S oxidoreductase